MKKQTTAIVIGVILVFILIIIPNFNFNKLGGGAEETPAATTPASSPMKMNISLSKATALGELTEITATVWYTSKIKEGMPETIANIELPEGFELVDGDLNWEGYVKNEPQQFSATIKAVEIGNWTIKARIRSPPTGKAYFGGGDNIYVSILEDKGILYSDHTRTPFKLPKEEGSDRAIKLSDSRRRGNKSSGNDNIITPEPTIEIVINTD